jgi:demethylmenaquinone methyltransferase/2-methoxy-6-polyprenyl-1,4-benzoquinol methylase
MTEFPQKSSPGMPLHRIFTAVPPRYDLVNRIITWGLDRRWRQKAARECLKAPAERVLDLACGTGDLAIAIARQSPALVVGIDYSLPMLEIARTKAASLVKGREPTFIHGDAANLPFADASFGCVGISFAFRNLTYQNRLARRHLEEVRRVLVPGGRYVIVETSQPRWRAVRWLYHRYMRWAVFRLGYRLSANKAAYHYLAESAANFYTAEEVKKMLLEVGFQQVYFKSLMMGVAGIHVAVR